MPVRRPRRDFIAFWALALSGCLALEAWGAWCAVQAVARGW
jgi:hypothetical protein